MHSQKPTGKLCVVLMTVCHYTIDHNKVMCPLGLEVLRQQIYTTNCVEMLIMY